MEHKGSFLATEHTAAIAASNNPFERVGFKSGTKRQATCYRRRRLYIGFVNCGIYQVHLIRVELGVFWETQKDQVANPFDRMAMKEITPTRKQHDRLPTLQETSTSTTNLTCSAVLCYTHKRKFSFQKDIAKRDEVKVGWHIDHGVLLIVFHNLR
jgi:hypothetical protein